MTQLTDLFFPVVRSDEVETYADFQAMTKGTIAALAINSTLFAFSFFADMPFGYIIVSNIFIAFAASIYGISKFRRECSYEFPGRKIGTLSSITEIARYTIIAAIILIFFGILYADVFDLETALKNFFYHMTSAYFVGGYVSVCFTRIGLETHKIIK